MLQNQSRAIQILLRVALRCNPAVLNLSRKELNQEFNLITLFANNNYSK